MNRRSSLCAALAASLIAATTGVPTANADDVSGNQSGTWTLTNSPYVVASTVTVPVDSVLTVEAGVVVSVADSQSIVVDGSLNALGTADKKITFTAKGEPQPGGWNSIQFRDGSGGTLDHCRILYTGYPEEAAIVCRGDAAPTISNSEIAHVAGSGVAIHDQASPVLSPNLLFAGLTSFGVRNAGSDTVNARSNWWGHATGPTHSGNPSGQGFEVSDAVDYAGFLTEEPVLWQEPAPPDPALTTGKDVYVPHEPIVVDFSGLPGNPGDWITVVSASLDSTTFAQWRDTRGEISGSLTFEGLPAGDYEARLYLDWPEGGYTIQARYPFTVEDSAPITPEDWTSLRVVNPDAERGAVSGWAVSGDFQAGQDAVVPYEGDAYFWGGTGIDVSTGTQDIDVAAYATLIAEERLTARVGGWMRVYEGGNDVAHLRVEYYDGEGELLTTGSPDSVTATTWTERTVEQVVPVGTATIRIVLSAKRKIGGDNDGYFDAVYARVKATDPPPEDPTIALSTSAITFDTTAVGAASVMPLKITNAGPGLLSITGIVLTGENPAAFEASPTHLTVDPDSSEVVSISFAPAFVGSKAATMALVHNGTHSPATVTLSGRAKAAPPLAIDANLRVPDDFTTIQAAIDAAEAGDVVRVSAGTYVETLRLRPGISVLGAGAGTTVIDSTSDNVVKCADNTVISGFTISGGNNGVFVPDSTSATVEQCVISENSTGILAIGATTISRNMITRNVIGILVTGPSSVIANNVVVYNRGEDAIGIALLETGAQVVNNTVDANELAGIYAIAPEEGPLPTLDIRNNVVSNNGVAGIAAFAFDGVKQTIGYNNAWNNADGNYDEVTPGTGSVSSDPMYVQPVSLPSGKPAPGRSLASEASLIRARLRATARAQGGAVPVGAPASARKVSSLAAPDFDYQLKTGSPSIDAGDPAEAHNDGDGTRNDQGAYGGPSPLSLEAPGEPEPPPREAVLNAAIVEQVDVDQNLLTVKHGDLGTAGISADSLSITGLDGQTIGLSDLETGWTLDIRGTVSSQGALTATLATVTAVPPIPPIGPGEDGVGPLALDLDLTVGHQGTYEGTEVLVAGDTITVELVATNGVAAILGAQIQVEYNNTRLEFLTATASTDLLTDASVLSEPMASGLSLSVEAKGGPAERDSGSLVQLTFGVLADLTKETTVRLVSGSLTVEDGTRDLEIGPAGRMVVVGGIAVEQPKTTDFSGDGLVNFQDFVQFAQNFGKQLGTADYDARFDLDGDDKVGFGDFVIFAQSFGQPAG